MPGLEIKTNYLQPEEVTKVDINSLTEKNKTWVKEQLTDLAKSIDPKLDVKKDALKALDNLWNEVLITALSKFKNADGTYKSFNQLEKGTSPQYAFLLQSALKKAGAYDGKLDGVRWKASQAALNTFSIMDAKGNYVSNLPVAGLVAVLTWPTPVPIKVQEKSTTLINKPIQAPVTKTEKPANTINVDKNKITFEKVNNGYTFLIAGKTYEAHTQGFWDGSLYIKEGNKLIKIDSEKEFNKIKESLKKYISTIPKDLLKKEFTVWAKTDISLSKLLTWKEVNE